MFIDFNRYIYERPERKIYILSLQAFSDIYQFSTILYDIIISQHKFTGLSVYV